MSAYGYKQTYRGQLANVRFTPKSGRKWMTEFMSASDPKRTLRVAVYSDGVGYRVLACPSELEVDPVGNLPIAEVHPINANCHL